MPAGRLWMIDETSDKNKATGKKNTKIAPDARLGSAAAWLQPLPDGGRVYIDRPLPFLVLNRHEQDDASGLAPRVATICPSNIVWPAQEEADAAAMETLRRVFVQRRSDSQQFLVVTLYDLPIDDSLDDESTRLEPFRYVIGASADAPAQAGVKCLSHALGKVCIDMRNPKIESIDHAVEEPAFAALLDEVEGISQLTLGIPQIHRVRGEDGQAYPLIRDAMETATFDAVLQACASFIHETTPGEQRHYRAYGRSRMVEAALQVDRSLDRISRSFDFLLSVSPINTTQAYDQFLSDKCAKPPKFQYRPLTVSPVQTKRALYEIDVHAAEDPVLEELFNEKRRELDLQLLMLQNRNTPDFRYSSLLQYGPVESPLLAQAHAILTQVQPGSRPSGDCTRVDCHAVQSAAQKIISGYQARYPGFNAEVALREDIGMGLMVTGQSLLISTASRVPRGRLDALLQHEIGVHVVTAVNGNRQPLGIFGAGLANYEGLQEGLGVFAEFMVDGLTEARIRLLAARVVAVEAMLSGDGFVDCHQMLNQMYGFSEKAAFNIVARIFRSGGLTKDAIYLRGLKQVFDFIAQGNELAPLWFGKIAEHHVPIVHELQERGLLHPPLATPEFLSRPVARRQLARIRDGASLIHLISEPSPC